LESLLAVSLRRSWESAWQNEIGVQPSTLKPISVRSKMSKQATIFRASCASQAKAKCDAATKLEMDDSSDDIEINFWDKEDFDKALGFDISEAGTTQTNGKPNRIVNCWFEKWEESLVADDSDVAHNRLIAKYRGLEFVDLDPPHRKFRIDNALAWNDVDNEWCLRCISSDVKDDDDEGDIENSQYVATWAIQASDVYDCILSYYKENSDLGIVAVCANNDSNDNGN